MKLTQMLRARKEFELTDIPSYLLPPRPSKLRLKSSVRTAEYSISKNSSLRPGSHIGSAA